MIQVHHQGIMGIACTKYTCITLTVKTIPNIDSTAPIYRERMSLECTWRTPHY